MTNNFKIIGDFIDSFGKIDSDWFFHISVMIRHKDVEWFPNGKNNNARTIYSLNVSSSEELYDQEKLITTMCDSLHARAYINLVPKSYEKAASWALENSVHSYTSKNYFGLSRSWSRGVDAASIKEHSLFLIDIDEPDIHRVDEIKNYIDEHLQPMGDKVIIQVPSRTGIHLLCKKFDKLEFNNKFPDIDVKKNAMTILYCF